MAKRSLPASAFALPGLSRPDSKKPYGFSTSSSRDYFSSSSRNVSSKHPQVPTENNLNSSSSLVDDNGSLLPPETEHTLDNLTKARPRIPGRRSPSPLARRKFEHRSVDSADFLNSSLEGEITGKSPKDQKDDRHTRFKGRTTCSPGLVLTDDVGLSFSTEDLSVSRTSPKLENYKNRGNRPEVPPKPNRNRSRTNYQEGESDLVTGISSGKNLDKDVEEHGSKSVQPPPLPTSPPPLEDEMLPSLGNQTLNKEGKILLQESMLGNIRKEVNDSNFDYDLSTKLGKPIKDTNEFKDSPTSRSTNGSSASRLAKWQGFGRTWSESNQTSALTKVGTRIPDKQVSLDSAITSRLSKYEAPYSSRQRKPVDRSPSSRRRRFKPVTLPDEPEKNSEICEVHDSDSFVGKGTSYHVNSTDASFVRLRGMQSEKRSSDSVVSDHNKGIDVMTPQSPMERTINSSIKINQTGQTRSTTENFQQHGNQSDRFAISRTTNPEPTVLLEYDVRNSAEKAIEIETNETVPFVCSDKRTSDRTEVNKFKTPNSTIKGERSYSKTDCHEDRNDLMVNQQGSPGLTLPKVVIEYDGQVFSDPMAQGYDTETSDESKKAATFGKVANKGTTHEKDYESDGVPDADSDDIVGYGEYSDDEEDLDLGLDDVSLGDEDLTFEDLDSAREEMDRAKGIEDPELDQDDSDGVIDHLRIQEITELSEPEMEEPGEMLFQPPPMFASNDDGETEDVENAEEIHIMNNGYEVDPQSPVIPSSLLEQQPRDDKRFHNLALEVWTEDDCVDWLDYIGLGHFTTEFRENHVDGKMLKNINFQLLEEIGIDSPDEREVILSEIYRRFHPEEEDMFEMEIQGALQSASEQERMKIMAVLNAIRSPAFQAELGIAPSTGSSSPRDSETGFHTASETGSISSGMTAGSDDHHHDLTMPPPPPPPMHAQTESVPREYSIQETKSKGGKAKKQRKTSKDGDKSEKEVKSDKYGQKPKKHKGVSKLLDSLSLSSGSSKLTKLFNHYSSSSSSSSSTSPSKKLNPAMQYLLQAGPQGLIRIWPTALSEEMNYCSFMVNMTTTSAEIIKLVFVKYEVVDDPRRFYICETSLGKGDVLRNLLASDCPLLFQCRWQDPDKHRFELRCKNEGVIKMLFELEGYEDDLDYRSISLSTKTPCSEALPLIVKKFNLPGEASEYYLVEVSEENEDDREEVADHVCPLRLQMAWSAPDHVFRLCRRPTEGAKDDDAKDGLDGWVTDATEDVSQEQGIHSEVSSAQEDDELDITPAILGGAERDEIVEETSEDLMEGLARLDSVIEEESEAIASQELESVKQELEEKEAELRELRTRSETLEEKELEIVGLVDENKELRGRVEGLSELEAEIEDLRRENETLRRQEKVNMLEGKGDALAEKEPQVFRLQGAELQELRLRNAELRKKVREIEEKFSAEISLRDREIERLYVRNNELVSKEKELESLKERNSSFEGKELEKMRVASDEASSSQSELTSKLKALQERNDELSIEVAQAEKLKQINRELCQKVDEGEIMRQELGKSEAEKKQLREKMEELQRKIKGAEKAGGEEVENLRKENLVLVAQRKEADEMRKNIIKLTAQLRDMEKRTSDEAGNFQRKVDELSAEKQQLQERIAELEKLEKSERKTDTSGKEVEELKLENIFLVERKKEIDELKASVAKLAAEAKDNESFKQKYKELRDVESYLTKQISAAETIARQKDKKLKESENKINTLAEAVKDMEAKLEEQEQNQHYLDQLLAMLKDRDPTLLHLINTSLASTEPEEWC